MTQFGIGLSQPVMAGTAIDQSYGTGLQQIAAQPPVARNIDAILAATDDTVDHTVDLVITNAGDQVHLGSVLIPAGTGTAGSPGIDILAACLPAAFGSLPLPATCGLAIILDVEVSVDKLLWLTVVGAFL